MNVGRSLKEIIVVTRVHQLKVSSNIQFQSAAAITSNMNMNVNSGGGVDINVGDDEEEGKEKLIHFKLLIFIIYL
ncbi:hypothetical protein Glove_606g52 [Diversispora epigaea]|uniref:Uncharacterized protein n=1 Tax=Diversispora epigaea TaxID=1348612 RepID=A0A397GBH2_9GLOM|nr:hypothetical protein Glove_606g52 [Diversispora epigaea]